jgi:hypothetical protein
MIQENEWHHTYTHRTKILYDDRRLNISTVVYIFKILQFHVECKFLLKPVIRGVSVACTF